MNPFGKYLEHGWALTPLKTGSKSPYLQNWNEIGNGIRGVGNANRISDGAGLLLAFCDPPLCTIDVDDFHSSTDWLEGKEIDLGALFMAEDSVQIASGREGHAKLLFRLPRVLQTIRIQEVSLEFRCGDRNGGSVQDVLPPSIHPQTSQPYRWIGDWRDVPAIPKALFEVWVSLLEAPGNTNPPVSEIKANIQRIEWALDVLDPDDRYFGWLKVAMSLKSSGRSEAFDWWDRWSAQSKKYPGREACWKKWKSLDVDGGITLGTLFWMAERASRKIITTDNCNALGCIIGKFPSCSRANRLRTDVGNVDRFTDITQQNVRYVPTLDQWIGWQGERWGPLPSIYEIARYVARSIYSEAQQDSDSKTKTVKWGLVSQGKTRLDAMVNLAKQSQPIMLSDMELDASPHLLGTGNGTVDLSSGQLLPPDRDLFLTKSTAVPYDPDAQCPRWEQFVSEIMDGNEELIGFLHRFAGYALWGGNPEQVVAILYGTGSNGKSTFVNTLQRIVGDYARQIDPSSLMAQRFRNAGGCREDLIRLYRTRLAIATESGDSDRLDEGLIKSVSGGDRLYARAPYAKRGLEFTPEFLLMLATNYKPIIKGTDHAIWRRLLLIPFERSFRDEGRNNQLATQLASEDVGILRWLVEGCVMWQQLSLDPPSKVRAATEEYRTEMDIVGDWLKERCLVDPPAVTLTSRLYENYKFWCEEERIQVATKSWFGRNLEQKGFVNTWQGGKRARQGIQLKV